MVGTGYAPIGQYAVVGPRRLELSCRRVGEVTSLGGDTGVAFAALATYKKTSGLSWRGRPMVGDAGAGNGQWSCQLSLLANLFDNPFDEAQRTAVQGRGRALFSRRRVPRRHVRVVGIIIDSPLRALLECRRGKASTGDDPPGEPCVNSRIASYREYNARVRSGNCSPPRRDARDRAVVYRENPKSGADGLRREQPDRPMGTDDPIALGSLDENARISTLASERRNPIVPCLSKGGRREDVSGSRARKRVRKRRGGSTGRMGWTRGGLLLQRTAAVLNGLLPLRGQPLDFIVGLVWPRAVR